MIYCASKRFSDLFLGVFLGDAGGLGVYSVTSHRADLRRKEAIDFPEESRKQAEGWTEAKQRSSRAFCRAQVSRREREKIAHAHRRRSLSLPLSLSLSLSLCLSVSLSLSISFSLYLSHSVSRPCTSGASRTIPSSSLPFGATSSLWRERDISQS